MNIFEDMFGNFTLQDIAGSIEASLLLLLILFIAGYVIGWLSNVFDFRGCRFAMQALLSTPLAVAVLPIVIYLIGRNPWALWTLLAGSWLGFALLFRQLLSRWSRSTTVRVPRVVWAGCGLAVLWAVVVISTLADLQFKDRLYFSVPAYDYSLRTAFTAALAKAIPPSNPFFASSPPVPLRYHYFWMLLCSMLVRIAGVSPRHSMYGGTVCAGFVLTSLIAISLRFFVRVSHDFGRKVLIGCSLLLITGLDIVPTLILYLHHHAITPDMEWWNEQITSWLDVLLWAPHHVMSLVACMVGLIVLRQPVSTKIQRVIAIVIAGLAFASSVGLSVLVTFTFAVFVALWLPFAVLKRWWDDVAGLVAAGLISLLLAWPYLVSLLRPAIDGSGGGGRFLTLSLRMFPLAIDLIATMLHTSPQKLMWLSLPLLPLNYFLELGFFFVVGVLRIRSIRSGSVELTRNEETAWMMVATSFFIGTYLRSTTNTFNDLGWRCFLQAQLVLLLWAALLVDKWWSTRHVTTTSGSLRLAAVLLVLGLFGTVYQVTMLRIYPILFDAGEVNPGSLAWLDRDHQLGARNYALRSAYGQLSAMLPSGAILQYNPDTPAFIPHELYSGHDAAIGLPLCGAAFGGDVSRCAVRTKSISPLFQKPTAAQSAGLDGICREYKISVMLVDDYDPVWKENGSWVWTRSPLLANDHVRAFRCGDIDNKQLISSR